MDRRGADLRGVDWGGHALPGADLLFADLEGARLTDADLRGADLRGANLAGADLTGARLDGARLEGALALDTRGLAAPVPRPARGTPTAWRRAVARVWPALSAPGDLDDVLDTLDEVGAAMPGWGFPWTWVARALREAGRDADTDAVLVAGIALDPAGAARRAFARRLLDRGELDLARPAYEHLTSANPEDAQLHAERGYVLGRLGQLTPARASLEAAIAGGVAGPNTWAALGMVAAGQDDLPRARTAFTEAFTRSGGAPEHALSLAAFLEASGDLPSAFEALAALERAAIVAPEARVRAAEIAARAGDLDEARAHLVRALAEAPGHAAAASALAEVDARLSPGVDPPGSPRAPATVPAHATPVPLPLRPDELAHATRDHPDASPFVDHVFFASPHGIGHLVPAGDRTLVVFRGVDGIEVHPRAEVLTPVDAEAAHETLRAAVAVPTPAGPDVPPLFDGRPLAEELAHLAPTTWRPSARRRLDRVADQLAERFGIQPLAGDDRVLDGLGPDVVLAGRAGTALVAPIAARRRGAAVWNHAQAAAWLAVDRARFVDTGDLVPTAHADAWRGAGDALVGLVYAVWLRHFLGLARLWPGRASTFAFRGLAVLDAINAEQLRGAFD